MRVLGLIGLLLALLIVMVLARRALAPVSVPNTGLMQGLPSAIQPGDPASMPRNVREQSQLIQQQVQQAVENAMQQPMRDAPADAQ